MRFSLCLCGFPRPPLGCGGGGGGGGRGPLLVGGGRPPRTPPPPPRGGGGGGRVADSRSLVLMGVRRPPNPRIRHWRMWRRVHVADRRGCRRGGFATARRCRSRRPSRGRGSGHA